MLLVCMTSPSYQGDALSRGRRRWSSTLGYFHGRRYFSVVLLKAVFRDFKERYRTHTKVIHIYIYEKTYTYIYIEREREREAGCWYCKLKPHKVQGGLVW